MDNGEIEQELAKLEQRLFDVAAELYELWYKLERNGVLKTRKTNSLASKETADSITNSTRR
jgi:hypothetical protein